jgi:hypothetical protein
MPRLQKMLSMDELTNLISVKSLPLPARPKIKDIKIEEKEAWTGEDVLAMFLILDDASPEEDWRLPMIEPVTDLIRSTLRAAGESRFVNFGLGTQHDWDERYTYDPSSDD